MEITISSIIHSPGLLFFRISEILLNSIKNNSANNFEPISAYLAEPAPSQFINMTLLL
jgi:hypothetical protein